MNLDLRRLQQALDKDDISPLYLLFGEERYIIDQARAAIKKKALADSIEDFNFDQFYFPEDSAAKVKDAVETLPMMSSRRVIFYNNMGGLKESDLELLLPLIENPVPSTVLVLITEKVDKRTKLYKSTEKHAALLEAKRPYDNQLPVWIEYIAYQHDLKLSRESILVFQQLVGTNLLEVDQEMKKLKSYVGDRKEVVEKDVFAIVSPTRMESVFELTDAIGAQDVSKALTVLAKLMDQGKNEVGILAMVLRHIRILGAIRSGMREGLAGAKLGTKAGVPFYFLQQYVSQARLWDESKLDTTMEALYQTDRALKSSPLASHIWLENLILRTCHA